MWLQTNITIVFWSVVGSFIPIKQFRTRSFAFALAGKLLSKRTYYIVFCVYTKAQNNIQEKKYRMEWCVWVFLHHHCCRGKIAVWLISFLMLHHTIMANIAAIITHRLRGESNYKKLRDEKEKKYRHLWNILQVRISSIFIVNESNTTRVTHRLTRGVFCNQTEIVI